MTIGAILLAASFIGFRLLAGRSDEPADERDRAAWWMWITGVALVAVLFTL